MSKVRIVLADDHTVVRQGLSRILQSHPDCEVVGEASDEREVFKVAASVKPDVVILDIAMPSMNGIEATRQIRRRLQNTQVLVLSMHADEAYVSQALKAGAIGYLLKESAASDL